MGITDREALGMGGLAAAAAAALSGGMGALMLREKDLPDEQLLPIARDLRTYTRAAGALFVINRRLSIARASGADGVHLGADGPTLRQARDELGAEACLGYSAHDINEALGAFEEGADYVIFSPIFETPSKQGILQPVGLDALARLARAAPGPVIGLGGVSAENIGQIAATGAAGAAAIRAIFARPSPRDATSELIRLWAEASPNRSGADQPASP